MLIRKPWSFGSDIKDRDYLDAAQSFEELVNDIMATVAGIDLARIRFAIEPTDGKYTGSDRLLKALACRRASWAIPLNNVLMDKFFNGLMGIRAQYYRSPYNGRTKNALLLSALQETLLKRADSCNPCDSELVRRSLNEPSAKTWICERNLAGEKLIRASDLTLSEQEIQNDWLELARALKGDDIERSDYQIYSAALSGVRAPIADQLLVKGAWITARENCEYVTPDKRDRDWQLFMFGFT